MRRERECGWVIVRFMENAFESELARVLYVIGKIDY